MYRQVTYLGSYRKKIGIFSWCFLIILRPEYRFLRTNLNSFLWTHLNRYCISTAVLVLQITILPNFPILSMYACYKCYNTILNRGAYLPIEGRFRNAS